MNEYEEMISMLDKRVKVPASPAADHPVEVLKQVIERLEVIEIQNQHLRATLKALL